MPIGWTAIIIALITSGVLIKLLIGAGGIALIFTYPIIFYAGIIIGVLFLIKKLKG